MPVASEGSRGHFPSRASTRVAVGCSIADTSFCPFDQASSNPKQTLIAMSEQRQRRLPAPPPPPSLSSRKRTREESTLQQQQPSTWTPIGDDGTESSSALTSNKRRKSNMGMGIDLAVTTASTILHTAAEAVVVSAIFLPRGPGGALSYGSASSDPCTLPAVLHCARPSCLSSLVRRRSQRVSPVVLTSYRASYGRRASSSSRSSRSGRRSGARECHPGLSALVRGTLSRESLHIHRVVWRACLC